MDYAAYVNLADLCRSVRPRTPPEHEVVHGAEHLFIVTHQIAELWMKQVLVDLDVASGMLVGRRTALVGEHIRRAASALDQITGATRSLALMPPADFAQFRVRLGTASGAQSPQFRELADRLGVRRRSSPLYEQFVSFLAEELTTVEDLYRRGPEAGALYQIAEAFTAVSDEFWRWQVAHVETVRRAIGHHPGTGGSTGVRHLEDRIELPFPALWEARVGAMQGTAAPNMALNR